jgi:LysM repeat protein
VRAQDTSLSHVSGECRKDRPRLTRARRVVRRALFFILAASLALFFLKPSSVLAQDGGTPVVHIVAWGDTVTSIATQYGVTPDAIINANQLDAPNTIYAGQRLVIPGAQPAAAQAASAGGQHTVQPGETLYGIATRYGVTVDALRAANGLADNTVLAGQTLTIPADGTVPVSTASAAADGAEGVHTVQPGETLYRISLQYGVSVSRLADFNNLINPSSIYVGQQLRIPGSATATTPGYAPAETVRTHVVQPGETLYAIATRYGVTTAVITQANSLANPSLIHTGMTLTIPSGDALAPAPAPAAAPAAVAKSIVVDVSEQRAYVYENGQLRWTFVISTGMPPTETLRGNFHIQNKIPNAYASTWDLQMPNWLGFYWAGPLQNGFHALPIMSNGARLWGGVLGQKASYGCVILGIEDAQLLYDWAEVGTAVTVQD